MLIEPASNYVMRGESNIPPYCSSVVPPVYADVRDRQQYNHGKKPHLFYPLKQTQLPWEPQSVVEPAFAQDMILRSHAFVFPLVLFRG